MKEGEKYEWIDMKEMCPPIGKQVLQLQKEKVGLGEIKRYNEGHPEWVSTNGCFGPSHWMNLPKSPLI